MLIYFLSLVNTMEENPNKNKEVNEPGVLYKSERLSIYSSFEAAAEAEAKYVAKQDPVDRIKEVVQLILKIFPLTEKNSNSNKIYIDKS